MTSSSEMPYFINPSLHISSRNKIEAYRISEHALDNILIGITDPLIKMVTFNSVLKTNLPYFYWVGFYVVKNGKLEIGPYQGTLGCLYIEFGKGVCGKAAAETRTQIVEDCHLLIQGTEHIACDPNSRSEIVIPVIDANDKLIAVLDVDSTLTNSFDEIDQLYLEKMVNKHFK